MSDANKWLKLESVCELEYNNIEHSYACIEGCLDGDDYESAYDHIDNMKYAVKMLKKARSTMDDLNVEITSEGVKDAEV